MEPKTKLSKASNCPSVDSTLYKSIIGSLRYLVNTRPGLSYSVGVMSRYMEAPTMVHMEAVKQILRYVKGTIDIGCHYVKAKQVERNNCMGIQLHGLQRNKRWWHFHPVKRSILRQRQLLVKEYG